jgi:hypothetical protein
MRAFVDETSVKLLSQPPVPRLDAKLTDGVQPTAATVPPFVQSGTMGTTGGVAKSGGQSSSSSSSDSDSSSGSSSSDSSSDSDGEIDKEVVCCPETPGVVIFYM